jgi:hypothetical protein
MGCTRVVAVISERRGGVDIARRFLLRLRRVDDRWGELIASGCGDGLYDDMRPEGAAGLKFSSARRSKARVPGGGIPKLKREVEAMAPSVR